MTPTSSLAGKRALVTGGSSGIGAATVRRLASRGATVAVNYRSDRKSADALVGELRDSGCAASASRPIPVTGRGPTSSSARWCPRSAARTCWSATPGSSTSERDPRLPRPGTRGTDPWSWTHEALDSEDLGTDVSRSSQAIRRRRERSRWPLELGRDISGRDISEGDQRAGRPSGAAG
ncbi:SDR family NAD(P)-dependent oxidoreductase [Streptomyces sp. SL54]|uniref:SDR family NAD(P)-dependent oxidoreductase n=2 Tax=Streptantibioticus silvisoli TaxID=2705255 RepID=A0ABT6VVB9_9ACTN|nr:SDR family NAD(P)-dependent oxidoreductase [Streptantibioticus silvisoli]